MGESRSHTELVREVQRWIREQYGAGVYGFCLSSDLPEFSERPPLINNFRPDVIAWDVTGSLMVIGEAKTGADVETKHSLNQYKAFLDHLRNKPNPTMVVATTLLAGPTAVNALGRAARESGNERVARVILAGTRIWRTSS